MIGLLLTQFTILVVAVILLLFEMCKMPYSRIDQGFKENWKAALRCPVYLSAWLAGSAMVCTLVMIARSLPQ